MRRTHRNNLISDTLAHNLLYGHANHYQHSKNSELDAYPIASNPQTMRFKPRHPPSQLPQPLLAFYPPLLPPMLQLLDLAPHEGSSPPPRMSSSLIFSTTRPISTRRQLKKWGIGQQEWLSGLLNDSSYRRQLKKWGFGQQERLSELFKEVNTERWKYREAIHV